MPRLLSSRFAAAGALVAALVGLLTLIAVAGRAGRGSVSASGDKATLPGSVLDFAFTLALIAAAGGLVVVALALRAGQKRPGRGRRVSPFMQLAGIVALGFLLWFGLQRAKRGEPLEQQEIPFGLTGTVPTTPGTTTGAIPAPGRPLEFRWEAAAVAAGLLAAAVMVAVVLRHRRRRAFIEPSLPERVGRVIDDTLDDLRREPDPRRAVIAAYARAEHGLAGAGAPRRPAEAPLEYLSRVLRELRVRPAAVLELTELFERAKFSAHTIDAAMKSDAIAALVAVREDLRP